MLVQVLEKSGWGSGLLHQPDRIPALTHNRLEDTWQLRFARDMVCELPSLLPRSVTVAQVTLDHFVMVRIHARQPFDAPEASSWQAIRHRTETEHDLLPIARRTGLVALYLSAF